MRETRPTNVKSKVFEFALDVCESCLFTPNPILCVAVLESMECKETDPEVRIPWDTLGSDLYFLMSNSG